MPSCKGGTKEESAARRHEYYLTHKEQCKALGKIWRAEHIDQARANWRAWYHRHKEERLPKLAAFHNEHREEIRARERDRYRITGPKKRDPMIVTARSAVNNAVQAGKLIVPKVCLSCGGTSSAPDRRPVEAHHYLGYAPEHWLDIIWLCHRCHSRADRKMQ
jgi:hypothetical protein